MRTACYYITLVHSTIETTDRFHGSTLMMPVSQDAAPPFSSGHQWSRGRVHTRTSLVSGWLRRIHAAPLTCCRQGSQLPRRCCAIARPAFPEGGDARRGPRTHVVSYCPPYQWISRFRGSRSFRSTMRRLSQPRVPVDPSVRRPMRFHGNRSSGRVLRFSIAFLLGSIERGRRGDCCSPLG